MFQIYVNQTYAVNMMDLLSNCTHTIFFQFLHYWKLTWIICCIIKSDSQWLLIDIKYAQTA